jgi:hypothetical protein
MASFLQVLRILKRCKIEEIHAYGRDKLGKRKPHILVDETRINDALVSLSRKGLVKWNGDGTWELRPDS